MFGAILREKISQIQTSMSKILNIHNDTLYSKVIINLAKFMEKSFVYFFKDFSQIYEHQIGAANYYTFPEIIE